MAQNGERAELVPTGTDTSAVAASGAPARFEYGNDGKTGALVALGNGLVWAP